MASSIRACTVDKCELSSCAICHCCQKDLCLDHLKEHKDQLNAKLNPFVNQINAFMESLEDFDPRTLPSFATIEQWRTRAHQIIDQFCNRLCNELIVQKKNQPLEKLRATRNKLDQLVRKQGATRENIALLGDELLSIEQDIHSLHNIQIHLQPLTIDESAILRTNSLNRSNQSAAAASNNSINLSQANGSFQIFVQLPNGPPKLIMIHPSDTIKEIKRKILDREYLSIDAQHLLYMGKDLMNQYTAADYDLQPLRTINLTYNLRKQ